jgi:hypothetical protein
MGAGMTPVRSLLLALSVSVLLVRPAAALDLDGALDKLGFPPDTRAKVAAGQFVETSLTPVADTDLTIGIAFLVKQSPETLTRALFDDLMLQRVDPSVAAYGTLSGPDATADELAKLTLTPAETRAYAAAAPGTALNLSPGEITELQAAGKDPKAIAETVKRLLLLRHRAYRTLGIPGMASYARAKGSRNPGSELTAMCQEARTNAILPAAFYDLLDEYPKKAPADLKETFTWSQLKAHGADTIVLGHAWTESFGGALVAVQRQYYVSTGYNAEQAIAGFVPVTGGTLVVYTNHTSTDQVTGVGGGAKRSLGRKFMASQLEDLFKKVAAGKR